MTKTNESPSMTEDYIQRIEWEHKNRGYGDGRAPWKNAPDWKYNPVYAGNKGRAAPLAPLIVWLAFIIVAIGILVIGILVAQNGAMSFLGILFLSILMIFYWMTRPPKKKK